MTRSVPRYARPTGIITAESIFTAGQMRDELPKWFAAEHQSLGGGPNHRL